MLFRAFPPGRWLGGAIREAVARATSCRGSAGGAHQHRCRHRGEATRSGTPWMDDGLTLADFLAVHGDSAVASPSSTTAAIDRRLLLTRQRQRRRPTLGASSDVVQALQAETSPESVEAIPPRPARVHVETYGCAMNVHDSQIVASLLQAHPLWFQVQPRPRGDGSGGERVVDDVDAADVVLLNTCAIREKAETRVLQRLRYLRAMDRKHRPAAARRTIGVLGCMAERLKTRLLEGQPSQRLVDLVVGPDAYDVRRCASVARRQRRVGVCEHHARLRQPLRVLCGAADARHRALHGSGRGGGAGAAAGRHRPQRGGAAGAEREQLSIRAPGRRRRHQVHVCAAAGCGVRGGRPLLHAGAFHLAAPERLFGRRARCVRTARPPHPLSPAARAAAVGQHRGAAAHAARLHPRRLPGAHRTHSPAGGRGSGAQHRRDRRLLWRDRTRAPRHALADGARRLRSGVHIRVQRARTHHRRAHHARRCAAGYQVAAPAGTDRHLPTVGGQARCSRHRPSAPRAGGRGAARRGCR
eukprot:ctg_1530.g469